jgi:hypothetical protein
MCLKLWGAVGAVPFSTKKVYDALAYFASLTLGTVGFKFILGRRFESRKETLRKEEIK